MFITDKQLSMNFRDHHMNVEISRQCVYNSYVYITATQMCMNFRDHHMNVEISRQCVYNRYTAVYELEGSSYECGGK